MDPRMAAFHQIVDSYSKPSIPGVNTGGVSNGCGGPSNAEMIIGAVFDIGTTALAMYLDAKTQASSQAAQQQNQAAAADNKAIEDALGDAKTLLTSLAKDSDQYKDLKAQLDKIDQQLKAVEDLETNQTKLEELQTKYKDVKANVGGTEMPLSTAVANLRSGTKCASDLKGFQEQLTALNTEKSDQQKIASEEVTANFTSGCVESTFTYTEGGGKGQAVKFVNDNKGKYVTTGEDGKSVPWDAAFQSDMQIAVEADAKYAAKLAAQEKVDKIDTETLPNLFKDATKAISECLKDQIGTIDSPETLEAAIAKVDTYVQTLESAQITSADGKESITLGEYSKDESKLQELVDTGTNADTAQLEKDKGDINKKLKEGAKPKLEQLSTAYNNLKTMVAHIDKCLKEDKEAKGAQQAYENIKNGEARSGFQKFFGLGITETMKQRRDYASGLVTREQGQAQKATKEFVEKYKTSPSESLRGKAIGEMGVIKNTVKNNGLEELAKEYGFTFS